MTLRLPACFLRIFGWMEALLIKMALHWQSCLKIKRWKEWMSERDRPSQTVNGNKQCSPLRYMGRKKMVNDGKGQERSTLPFKMVHQNIVTYPSIRLIWPLWNMSRRVLSRMYWTRPICNPFTSCNVKDFLSDLLVTTFIRSAFEMLSISLKQASA